jgi:AcrR family transcriptional regulator
VPKVSDEHRENRRRQIQDAALRSFARKGFRGTSMSDIIAESGMSAGAIYGHYRSKSELAAAVAGRIFDRIDPSAPSGTDGDGNPLHPVDFAARILTGVAGEAIDPALPIQVWGEATFDEDVRAIFDAVYRRLRSRVELQIALWLEKVRGHSAADAASRAGVLGVLLVGLMQGAVLQRALADDFDPKSYFDAARPAFEI